MNFGKSIPCECTLGFQNHQCRTQRASPAPRIYSCTLPTASGPQPWRKQSQLGRSVSHGVVAIPRASSSCGPFWATPRCFDLPLGSLQVHLPVFKLPCGFSLLLGPN